jgi:tripartite-type tricarboxylate transporter receptor subunit TctC
MKVLNVLSGLIALTLIISPVQAQLTEQPIRIVFPFPAGGSGDAIVRLLADSLHESLRRRVIVENKAGAGGQLGVQAVKEAPADGSVLLFTPIAPMVIFPHVYDKLAYDPLVDFEPISQIATFDLCLAIGTAIPARSVAEFVQWLKANTAHANYGSPAAGSQPHFFGVQFGRMIGVDFRHAPYKGSPPAIKDLIGGHLTAYIGPTQELIEAHKSGHVRILATSGASRSPVLTDIPTFNQAGYPIRGDVWFAVYAPAKIPLATAERLNAAFVTAVKSPQIVQRMQSLGLRPTGTSREELARIQREDFDRWGPVVKASGFTPEQ